MTISRTALFLLDHAAFRRNRRNAENVIDSKRRERASCEKPVSTFSHRALGLALIAAIAAPSAAWAEGEEVAQCAAKWIEANQNPKFYQPWGDYFADCKKKLAEGAAAPKAEEAKPAAAAPAPEPEAKKAEPPKPAPAPAAAPAPAPTAAPTPAKPAKPAHKPAKKPVQH